MTTRRHQIIWLLPALLVVAPAGVDAQAPLGTEFSYQGQLKLAGAPLNGTADFEFALWDDPLAGSQMGNTAPVNAVAVTNGLFTVALNFGCAVFNGDARWLEIAVRSPAGGGDFTVLAPRQPLTGVPYALQTRGLYCDAAGQVGVGTAMPSAPLTVVRPLDIGPVVARFLDEESATSALDIRATSSRGEIQCTSQGEPTDLALNPDGGAVGIGTSVLSAADTLRLNGPGAYGTLARINFQDADYAYIDNPYDGQLTAHAYYNITLDAPGVDVIGMLFKSGGSFKIDHPLDPEHKYLLHSFVESPDMMNVYNGNVVLGADGTAEVTMPDWFEALNRDFRYQLTPIGGPGPNLYIAREIEDHKFTIAGGGPGLKVSWQVTGVRHDKWAEANRIPVEIDKPAGEWGHYRHPKAFGIKAEQGGGHEAGSSATWDGRAYDPNHGGAE